MDTEAREKQLRPKTFYKKCLDVIQFGPESFKMNSVPVTNCPFATLSNKFSATAKALQSWSQKKVGHVNSQLSLAGEVLHMLEIAQDV
jgi:hypothetical protein